VLNTDTQLDECNVTNKAKDSGIEVYAASRRHAESPRSDNEHRLDSDWSVD
jgi:hypothetical protein